MNHWFRLYNTLVDDPKVQQLPDALFKALINLWCIASQNNGVLPAIEDVSYKLRVKPERAAEHVTRLVKAGLIDNVDGRFVPHNWEGRQFRSDSSTPRVKQHREKKRNVSSGVSCNVSETAGETDRAEQNRSEQNTAEARALDQGGLKDETALRVLFTATRTGLGLSVPNMDILKAWLIDGIGKGTISAVVTPILGKKPDLVSLNYCDAAVREKHAKAQFTPSIEPVPLSESDWVPIVKRYKGNRSQWSRHAGPEPGMSGCRCPVQVLVDAGIDPTTGEDMGPSWFFIAAQTSEMAAHQHHASIRKVKPPRIYELDGGARVGFFSKKLVPDGYDEATGERIQSNEDAA